MHGAFRSIFTRNFMAVSFINLVMMSAYYMLMVTISSYALTELKASHSMAGLIAGSMVLGLLAGRFVSGKLISCLRFKTLLFFGIAEYLFFMMGYFIADTPEFFLVVRFLSGFGVGLVSTVTGTIVAHILPPDLMGTGISYYSLSTILATALGPFAGLLMMQSYGFNVMFWLSIGAGMVCCCATFGVTLERQPPDGQDEQVERDERDEEQPEPSEPSMALELAGQAKTSRGGLSMQDFIDYRAVPISIVVFLCGFGYSSIQAFISSYAAERNLMEAASLFFIVYAVVILCSRPITGRIMDERGADVIVYPSLLLFAAGLLLLSYVQSWWAFLLAGALVGGGFGNFQSTAQAIAIKMVPEPRFGHATSTFFIFLDIAVGIGPFMLGFIVAGFGYPALYQSMSLLALLCLGAYYLLQAHRPYYGVSSSQGGGSGRPLPRKKGAYTYAKKGD